MRLHFRLAAAILTLAACAKQLQPPTAVAAADKTEVAVGALVSLTGKDSADPNAPPQPLFFRWSFAQLPPGSTATLNDATIVSPSFRADVAGEYVVSLLTKSGKLTSAPATVKITAGPCGANAPAIATVAATPDKPGSGQAVLLSAEVSDGDNAESCGLAQDLSYQWSLLALPPGSAARLNLATAQKPSFIVDVVGDYVAQLVVTDPTGRQSAPKTLTISAKTCGSNAPSIETPVAQPAAPGLGQVVQLSAKATDADNDEACAAGQTLSYRWSFVSLPSGSAARLNDADIEKPSFLADIPGDYVLRARVEDGTGRSAISASVVVSASTCGGARPVVSASTATPASPHAGQVVQLDATVQDADADAPCSQPQSFRRAWRIVSLPAGSHAALNDAGADNPSFAADLPGRYQVELVVTDQAGLRSAPSTVDVNVSQCGATPPAIAAATATPAAPNVGQAVQLSADVSDADADATCGLPQALSYAWRLTSLPAGSHATLNAPAALNPSFVVDTPGTYAAALVVTDSTGRASEAKRVELSVGVCTTASPVVKTLSAAPEAPNVGAAVQLSAVIEDADADEPCSVPQSFSYAWHLVSLPAGSRAALNDAGARNPSFTVDLPGSYAAALVVTDATGRASDAKLVSFTVGECATAAPVVSSVTASPASPNVGGAVQLAAEVSDADAAEPCSIPQSFTFAWRLVSLPSGSRAALNAPWAVNPSFTVDVPGAYAAELIVTDQTGRASDAKRVELEVGTCTTAAPEIKTVTALPPSQTVGGAVQLSAEVEDADAAAPCSVPQSFSYAWRLVSLPSGSRASLNAPTAVNPSFTADLPGTYVASLVATDQTGRASRAQTVELTVGACTTAAPVVSKLSASPAAPNVGDAVQLASVVDDADALAPCSVPQSFRYAWRLLALPSGSHAVLNDAGARNPSFRADVAGTYTAQLVVTDQTGRVSSAENFDVVASACGGAAPTVDSASASPASPDIGQVVRFDAVVSDADASAACGKTQNLSYAWRLVALPAGSHATLNAPASKAPSILADLPGAYTAELVVTDQTGLSSEARTVTATATTCGSARPSATVTAPASAAIGSIVAFTAVVTDADTASGCGHSAAVRYAWSFDSVPAGSAVSLNDTGVASPSFVPDLAGTYRVRLVVTDVDGLASVAASGEVTVSTCGGNAPAVVVSATPAAPGVDTAVQLASVVTDADTDAACGLTETFTYAWSFVSVPAGSHASFALPGLASPSFVPDLEGSYVVQVAVTDSTAHRTISAPFTIDVNSCGAAAPVASIAASTVAPAAGSAVLLTASATDADTLPACGATQTFTWAWSFDALPAGSLATLNDAAATSPSFIPDLPGDYVVALVATDSTGLKSLRETKRITASTCTTAAPSAAVTASTTAPGVGQAVLLTATVSDDDNLVGCDAAQTFSVAWSFTALPAGSRATLNAPAATSPSFVPDLPGVYVVSVVPTDSTARKGAAQSVTITASTCGAAAPVATASASTTTPSTGQSVRVSAVATDADNDPACGAAQTISYAWSLTTLPAGSRAALQAPAALTPSFTADVPGTYVAQVVASDSTGRASAPVSVTITADACGSNPPAATIAQSPASVGTGMAVTLSPTVTDADNGATCQALASAPARQTFTYAWTLLSAPTGSAARLVSATARDAAFTADAAGAYLVRLVVTDSSGLASTPVEFTVTAGACGSNTPAISAATASTPTPNVGQSVALSATFDDTDNGATCQAILGALQTFNYGWSISSAPAGSSARILNSGAVEASFVPDVAGAYVLTFTVNDATARLASRNVSLTVGSCGATAPTVSVTSSGSAIVGGLVSFEATATDADNTAPCSAGQSIVSHTWTLVEAPAGSRATLLQGVKTTSFVPDVAGTYAATVVATDSTGRSSDPARVSTVVGTCGGQAPVAVALSGGDVTVGFNATLDGSTSSDPDNAPACGLAQPLSYQWELFSVPIGSAVTLQPSSTVVSPWFRTDKQGAYVVRLRVTDSTGRSSAVVTQTVNAL